MNRSAGTILVRLAFALAGSLTFLAVGMFSVKKYLPADYLLIRQLHFSISSDISYSQQQWSRFGQDQQAILERMARENIPDLAGYTDVIVQRDFPTITVRMRCPSTVSSEYINEGLEKLLHPYRTYRSQMEPLTGGESGLFDIQMSPSNLDQIKEYTELQAQLVQQKNELQLNRRQLTVQNLELNQSLDRGLQQEPSGPLAEYIKPHLDRLCSIDAQTKQLLARLREQQKIMANLEFQASRSQSSEQTSQLYQQIQDVNDQCLLLQRQLSQRRGSLAQGEIQRVWYLYEAEAHKRISHNQQLLEQNGLQLQQIEGRLSQTQNTLTRLDPLRQAILSEESSAASDDDAAFASAVQYRQELDDKSNIYPFSRLQQMLMGLAALAGFFMGLLVPIGSGLVITETTKSNVALQESEDLDDYIKDPREQYINKSANRLDRMPVSGENISENRPIHSVRDVVNERIAPVRTKRQDSFFAEPSPILSQFYSADRKIEFDSLPKPPVIPQPENVAIRQPQIEPPPPPVEPAPIIIPEPVVDQESQVQSTPKPLPKEACRPTEPKASDCKETVATPPEQEKPSEVRESIGMWEESIIYVQETDTDWFWPVESKPAVKLSEDQEKSKVLRSEPEVVKSGIRRADDTVRKPGEREVVEEPTVMADSDIAGEPVIMAVQPENITDQPSVPVLYYLDKGDLADQGDLQLYINEDDLRAMQTTSSGGLTSDEPVYFYLYVDEQHLADNPPVEPVEVPESQKKKNTEAEGQQRFTAEVPQLKSEPASMQSDVNGRHLESDPPESPIPSELPDIADTDKKPQMLLQPDDNEPPLEFMEDITGLEFMAFEGLPEVEEYVIEPESTGDIAPPILCYEPSGFKLPELSQKEQESKVFVVSETAVSAVKPAVGKCEKLKNSSIKDKYVSEKAIDSKQEGQKKAPIEPEKMEKTEIKSESSKTAEKPAMSENVTDKVETSRTILPAEHQAMLLATVDLDKDLSTDLRPDSPYARIFKNIDRMRADNPCPIILVSSLKPAELSPRFAVNLGLALVTRKLRVLLIEAEQVSDDLAAVFEMAPNAGFFEWRRGEVWASKAIHETMMPGMSFMASGVPSGDQGGNQIDLGKEMHRWSNLRRNYDMLFLYSRRALSAGPVAPDEPVGLALLDMADGVLGLTRLDKPQSNDKPLDIPGNVECIQTVLARRKGRSLGLVGISS